MNPLLFSPSVRNIPAVLELWEKLPYDHLIEKYKMPLDAKQSAKRFFLENTGYTHLVVMPDDLEVVQDNIDQLIEDIEINHYEVIGGMCNIDESQPHVYNIQPNGISYESLGPRASKGSWYADNDKPLLPDKNIFQVGFNGFALMFIERSVMEQLSFVGAADDGQSNFDWNACRECYKLGIPVMTDKRVNMYHRRFEQYDEAKAFKKGILHKNEGHSFLKTKASKGF